MQNNLVEELRQIIEYNYPNFDKNELGCDLVKQSDLLIVIHTVLSFPISALPVNLNENLAYNMKVHSLVILLNLALAPAYMDVMKYLLQPELGFIKEIDRVLTLYEQSKGGYDQLVEMCYWFIANVAGEACNYEVVRDLLSQTHLIRTICFAAKTSPYQRRMLSVVTWLASNLL